MLKVIEVLAESSKSWEDATQTAVGRANETVRPKPTPSTLRSHSRLKASRQCEGT